MDAEFEFAFEELGQALQTWHLTLGDCQSADLIYSEVK